MWQYFGGSPPCDCVLLDFLTLILVHTQHTPRLFQVQSFLPDTGSSCSWGVEIPNILSLQFWDSRYPSVLPSLMDPGGVVDFSVCSPLHAELEMKVLTFFLILFWKEKDKLVNLSVECIGVSLFFPPFLPFSLWVVTWCKKAVSSGLWEKLLLVVVLRKTQHARKLRSRHLVP